VHTQNYLYVHQVLGDSMSTTSTSREAVESCRPASAEPVSVPAAALASTAPEYLRDLKYELSRERKVPAEVTLETSFGEDCSFATQREAERVRDHVRAAAFLGAGRLTVTVEEVADPAKVRPALAAARERARREGVTLVVEGLDLD
jgi:hypothetical protein